MSRGSLKCRTVARVHTDTVRWVELTRQLGPDSPLVLFCAAKGVLLIGCAAKDCECQCGLL